MTPQIPTAQLWGMYHQRRNAALKVKGTVRDAIERSVTDGGANVLCTGETPDGDNVSLVEVKDGLEISVLVLVVGDRIVKIFERNAEAEAIAIFQRVVVLGQTQDEKGK
jgi:hypothetical protein